MAPHGENIIPSYTKSNNVINKPPRLPTGSNPLQRTKSDMSFDQLSKEVIDHHAAKPDLPPISEIEDAKCECCGMCEECTTEYINRVRDKFSGKLICGLCAAAVNEEMEKNGGKREEALNEHMNACVKFNKFGRTHPVLFTAEAMREMLKKSSLSRAKSMNPRENLKKGGIARSSSCIPAITRETHDRKTAN